MAHAETRSSPSVWLIGRPENEILGLGLPTNRAVLKNFMYHHQEMKCTTTDSAALTIEATLAIREKARIPAQHNDNYMRKLRKLFEQHNIALEKAPAA